MDGAGRHAQLLQALDARLAELHGLGAVVRPLPAQLPPPAQPAQQRGSDNKALAVGTSAGAAAGAAAGAKVGAMIDVGTGGLTLGVGTALGALLGGGTAWAVRNLQKKDAQLEGAQDLLQHMAEAACTRYLALAHLGRVPAQQADELGRLWQAEVTGTVAAHWDALQAALRGEPQSADPLLPLLRDMLRGILQRSFVDEAGKTP